MSLSRYRHAPRKGHLDRLMRVCGYVRKFPQAAIRICTGIPNHEDTFGEYPEQYDWMETVYGSPTEELPPNMPTPKGKLVRTTTYFDANLMHDVITGRSASGVLHFLNQTPWEWFSKCQAQVETATYGSEFMAACQAAVAAGIVRFHYIASEENPSNLLIKALPHYKARVHLEPLLFWKGETNTESLPMPNGNPSTPGLNQRGVTK